MMFRNIFPSAIFEYAKGPSKEKQEGSLDEALQRRDEIKT